MCVCRLIEDSYTSLKRRLLHTGKAAIDELHSAGEA